MEKNLDELVLRMRYAVPPGYHGHLLDEGADAIEELRVQIAKLLLEGKKEYSKE